MVEVDDVEELDVVEDVDVMVSGDGSFGSVVGEGLITGVIRVVELVVLVGELGGSSELGSSSRAGPVRERGDTSVATGGGELVSSPTSRKISPTKATVQKPNHETPKAPRPTMAQRGGGFP